MMMGCSMQRMIAYGVCRGGGRRRNPKPTRSAEEIQRELAQHLAAVALHQQTRRRLAERWYRQTNGPFTLSADLHS